MRTTITRFCGATLLVAAALSLTACGGGQIPSDGQTVVFGAGTEPGQYRMTDEPENGCTYTQHLARTGNGAGTPTTLHVAYTDDSYAAELTNQFGTSPMHYNDGLLPGYTAWSEYEAGDTLVAVGCPDWELVEP
jgi:hypothetical protein